MGKSEAKKATRSFFCGECAFNGIFELARVLAQSRFFSYFRKKVLKINNLVLLDKID
jgi:hypothetical protein